MNRCVLYIVSLSATAVDIAMHKKSALVVVDFDFASLFVPD